MKCGKGLVHKFGVIFLSIKTIAEIDCKYLYLLSSSMMISIILPFLDLYLLRNVIRLSFERKDTEATIYCLMIFVGAGIVLNALKSLVMWYRSVHYIRFGHYFDVQNAKKTMNIEYEKLQEKETQDLIVRAARGCSAVARVGEFTSDLVASVMQMVGTTAILIRSCHFYTMIIVALAFLCYRVEEIINRKRYENEKKGDTAERKIDTFLKMMLDSGSAKELRLYQAAPLFQEKYEDAEKEVYSLQCNSNIISFLGSALKILVTAGEMILVYLLASKQFMLGKIQLSDITLCVSSVTVFVAAFNAMFSNFASIGLMENRIHDFQEYQNVSFDSVRGNRKIEAVGDDFVIEFRNVCFSYKNGDRECLHDINLTIRKGDKLAIFGKNGAGKTTFIKLLLGLYVPTKGEILLNGINYLEYDSRQYHQIFSTVFQDFALFAYTIRENIMFDDAIDRESRDRICAIIEKVGLENKVKTLSGGIDTYITQEYDAQGESLSGGESQRVAIARAWYRQGAVMVMDEPTSAIDPIAQEKLFDAIAELFQDKTAILISHRMSSVRLCEKIVFFHQGIIAEYGTHDELMMLNGKYCELFTSQAQWYDSVPS